MGLHDGRVEPLYGSEDAERTLPLFRPVHYYKPCDLGPSLSYHPKNGS